MPPLQATDRPETTRTIPPPIPEVVWEQPPDTSVKTFKVNKINRYPTVETTQKTHMPILKLKSHIEFQTSLLKEILPQKSGLDTEPFWVKKPLLHQNNYPNNYIEIEETKNDMTAIGNGDHIITSLTIKTSKVEEMLVRNENTNEL